MTHLTVLHIPHASRFIPDTIHPSLVLSDDELSAELLRVTDLYTDELFRGLPAKEIVFPISRLIVDPERFLDDEQEVMSRCGWGAVYMKTSAGKDLRGALSPGDRQRLINTYYKPHHAELERMVRESLDARGMCLIIDCHSFPLIPLPNELDQSPDRPDICIGTDSFHTPGWLASKAITLFQDQGYRVKINSPFAGTMVPSAFYRQEQSVFSIMVEVNRSLYMNEQTGERLPGFDDFALKLQSVIRSFTALAFFD